MLEGGTAVGYAWLGGGAVVFEKVGWVLGVEELGVQSRWWGGGELGRWLRGNGFGSWDW